MKERISQLKKDISAAFNMNSRLDQMIRDVNECNRQIRELHLKLEIMQQVRKLLEASKGTDND